MQISTGMTIDEQLQIWGTWAQGCSAKSEVGTYTKQPFVSLVAGGQHDLSESELIALDTSIAALFGRDEQLMYVLVYYYQFKFSYRNLAELLNRVAQEEPKFILPNGKKWNVSYLKQLVDIAAAKLDGYLIAKAA